jgi:hypothetical protein
MFESKHPRTFPSLSRSAFMAKKRRAPWKRKNPRKAKGKASKHLTRGQKATAKRRAKRAGRSYPNLVDNMRVAARSRGGAKKKRAAKRRKKR